jgi:hypothetical protein
VKEKTRTPLCFPVISPQGQPVLVVVVDIVVVVVVAQQEVQGAVAQSPAPPPPAVWHKATQNPRAPEQPEFTRQLTAQGAPLVHLQETELAQSVLVVVVVVVVDVVGHGVVRGRHLRTNVSRSLRGMVPFAAVAFAESRTMAGCLPSLSGSGIATKLPQAEPSSEPGTTRPSLGLTTSFWSRVGGWQAARFGSVWLMQTPTLNVQEPLPHSPSVSQGSPSVQATTRPPRTSGPGLSMPTTLNST